MNAKPEQKTIENLLTSGKKFIIPRFQREYSWDKQNYCEFFNDILYNIRFEKNTIKSSQYFLGTMLFIGDFTNGNLQIMEVIDGQQRLTNITILLSALSKRLEDIGESTLSNKIFKYIIAEDNNGEDVRILNTITSHPYFSFYIQEKDKKHANEKAQSDEEKLIKETYDYFYSRLGNRIIDDINKYLNLKITKGKYLNILKSIRDQILNSVIISITTSDKKEANQIFEILNAKGKKLTYIDLIKNRIFGKLKSINDNDFAIKKWDEIRNILSNSKVNVGFPTFLLHYWASKYKRVPANKMYDEFKNKIKENNYESFLTDLSDEANNYIKIVSPSREQYNNRKEKFSLVQSLDAITNSFDIIQTRVLLLSLLYLKDKKYLSAASLNAIVKYIEDFHFAYNAVVSLKTNRLNSIYSSVSLQLRNAKSSGDAMKIIDLNLKKNLDNIYPSYQEFENGFVKLKYSKNENPSNLKTRYAVNRINCYFAKTDLFSIDGSIEHIINEDKTNQNTLQIGNLILLETKINNSIKTNIYSEKIGFYKKSKYEWVKKFIKENQSFNDNNIIKRSKQLAELYYTKVLHRKK